MNKRVKNKLVWGVGKNDADYVVQKFTNITGEFYQNGLSKQKLEWSCPIYQIWKSLLQRCYSPNWQEANHTYVECTVEESWLLFSNFRDWVVRQDWEGNQLDKDILFLGNKHYSEDTCVFISQELNKFLTESTKAKGEYPTGVSWRKDIKRFAVRCSNPFTKKREFLGMFDCQREAGSVWLKRKIDLAHIFAGMQKDQRVADALISRYENYKID